ncbi:MAG: hypothetical protein D3910_15645 [Candidatus Electrothrix sp. ATG2]|nr:hypothetical protein [Candidatus Electrothrix sp. ATG2]
MPPLSQEDQELLSRLNSRPDLKNRVKSILSIACDDGDRIVRADEAENRIIGEVRRMGNEVLTEWAESRDCLIDCPCRKWHYGRIVMLSVDRFEIRRSLKMGDHRSTIPNACANL